VLHEERFVDKAPAEIYATLLDEGRYLCSIRTMYRILKSLDEVRERRNQLRHPQYKKPELLAVAANQVWSWDITKLKGPAKWNYYYLYVILDIFSRYAVGWMIATRETAELAKMLIAETCMRQGIDRAQLIIHSDRGSPMKSKAVALLLSDLGVGKSFNRPYVSNDNPYSESQFKTLKDRPQFPDRFGSIQDARAFCRRFFAWYNDEHYHGGIALMTPATVHYGQAQKCNAARQKVLWTAHDAHPERFVRGRPKTIALPPAVWINKPNPVDEPVLLSPAYAEDCEPSS
jgi:putative transposase